MPDEDKHDENLHELDREPATGSLNESANGSEDTEQRASSAWGGNSPVEQDKDEKTDFSDEDAGKEKEEAKRQDGRSPLAPLHDDIRPATIPMSTRPREAAPTQETNDVAVDELPKPGPGLLVLQWLTYAFWGWTVFSLSGLVITVVSSLLNQSSSSWGGGIAYLLAAVIVLFIIALVTDMFYARAERKHARTTGTNVIMIIHAVIFALFGIGSLIAAVFGLVSLLINDTSGSTGPMTGIVSGAIIAVLYGLTLLRTLRPRWIKGVVSLYWVIMTLAVIVTVALGIIGPAAQARLQNEDRAVEEGLPRLADAINEYANNKGALPKTLGDLTDVQSSAKTLIDQNKVTYKPEGKLITSTTKTQGSSSLIPETPVYRYQLCVDYKAKDDISDSYYGSTVTTEGRYRTDVTTYGHKAGHVCYKLQSAYSSYSY